MAKCKTLYVKVDKETKVCKQFPCGKCPECLQRRASGWSFRLMQEDKRSSCSNFITLTYDTKHVPITPCGYMGLEKRHLQLFFKRLRKAFEKEKGINGIKYYACGEYGTETFRPHYHIILFNAGVEFIQKAWNMGEVHYGSVTGASVGYTLKYMTKRKRIPVHRNDDRQPEFSLMSKGLGDNYITREMVEWHVADLLERMYCNLLDGKKIAMPRYYKDKIYSRMQRSEISGFWKGVMEKVEDEKSELQTMEQIHNEVESDLHKFRLMYQKAEERRNVV